MTTIEVITIAVDAVMIAMISGGVGVIRRALRLLEIHLQGKICVKKDSRGSVLTQIFPARWTRFDWAQISQIFPQNLASLNLVPLFVRSTLNEIL